METTHTPEQAIEQTRNWLINVVVGCNFCPFANREVKRNSIHYQVEQGTSLEAALQALMRACMRLDDDASIETTLIIFPNGFQKFEDYLDLVSLAEKLLKKEKYEGTYQVASFHPDYQFAGSPADDAANYTNRSIYPMLHLLREESIEKALEHYKGDPGEIPVRNIEFAREKGPAYMKMLRNTCL